VTVPAAQAIMSSNVFFEPRVRRTPDVNMSVEDDSKKMNRMCMLSGNEGKIDRLLS
jgi:hypothetical protein